MVDTTACALPLVGDTEAVPTAGSLEAGWAAASGTERVVAAGALALGVASAPHLGIGSWPVQLLVAVAVGAAGLPRLVALAFGRRVAGGASRAAAVALVGWLGVGLASALVSPQPALGLVGQYAGSGGWVLMAAMAGWWALGTAVGGRGRRLLAAAVVAAAVANGVVAIGQATVGLARFGLPGWGNGQAMGFQGNPVFLGGLEAGTVVLLAWQAWHVPSTRRRWLAVAVVAVGLGAAGERLSLLVALVTGATVALATWWPVAQGTLRRLGWAQHPVDRPQARRFATLAVAGSLVGALLPDLRRAHELSNKLATGAEGTFGDRLHAWLEGFRALAHHPLLGVGPGQFQAATSALFPLWFDRSHPGQVFTDAHDLFVEYAVTTGVLGVVCLVAWLVAAVRHRGGGLLWCALAMLTVELVEPVNVVLTPLVFLAVGAAAAHRPARPPRAEPPRVEPVRGGPTLGRRALVGPAPRGSHRVLAAATVVTTAVGACLGLAVVAGSRAMVVADQDRLLADQQGAVVAATVANDLLRPWPQPAAEMAMVQLLGRQSSPQAPTPLALAAHWEEVAAERDSANSPLWVDAAALDLRLGRRAAARRDALMALRFEPWDVGALQELGDIDLAAHDRAAAAHWFARLVLVRPRPTLKALLAGDCQGPMPGHPVELPDLRRCQW